MQTIVPALEGTIRWTTRTGVFRVSVGYKGKQQTYGDENDSGMAMYTITKNIGLCFLGRYGGMCLNCILHMVATKEAAIR